MEGESRSTDINTSTMESREGCRPTMALKISPTRCCTIDTLDNEDTFDDDTFDESPQAMCEKKKERKSVLDRLTIVSVETSSTKKKKGRRKHAPRNHKPLPEDVMLKPGHSDSISNIPDSFSNSLSKDEEAETKWLTNDQIPHLFTFDLVPSFSEDPFGDDATEGNDTTDANIGEEEDLSGIFDEFDDSDEKCVRDVEEKYSSGKYTTDTNMETLAALSKLELNTRTRTASTAFSSDMSSSDNMSTQLEKETTIVSAPSKSDQVLDDEMSLVPRNDLQDLQLEASRCISFNIFSMFD